jgi:ATP-dependent DNA helicase RecG
VAELGLFHEEELTALTEAGIHSLADLLRRAPVRHHRGTQVSITGAVEEEPVVVRAPVRWRFVRLTAHGRRWEVGIGGEDSPPLRLRWFREPPRGWDVWEPGQEIGLYGEVREAEDGPTMYEAEPLGLYGRGSGFLPEYGIEGVEDRRIRDGIARALDGIDGTLKDWLPHPIRDQHRLLALDEALRDAHFPANATRRGRLRLAFDELFTIQVGVAWKSGRGKPSRGIAHKPVHTGIGQIESQHQIVLDDSQESVFSEIRRDLVRPTPMNRLLQGDVGSGKGLVAQLAALMVVGGGCQAAMVYPDSLAAERRFLHIDPIFRSIGIKTLLIPDERVDRGQLDAIRRGEAQVVFGTHAVLQKAVTWKRLGIVVAEERGTHGVLDLDSLGRRGTRPDLLVIPRAPIPSSLAFTVFGDFDVSTLHSASPRPIQCDTYTSTERSEAYTALREVVASGRQGYVVFPVRDGRDILSVEDAVRTAQALRKDLLPGAQMGVYSSEMSREERSRVFDDFQQRRIDVLVCTTYIEDSPEVTNATAMVVEYADMHDLVRLHRLRAHVSNGYRAGNCAFVTSENPDEKQIEQLEQIRSERDGFRLAELDLHYRGASAVLGSRASQAPEFTWAVPPEDRGLFLRARAAAFELIRRDPELRNAGDVAETVNLRWGDWLGQALPKAVARKRSDGRRRRRKRR